MKRFKRILVGTIFSMVGLSSCVFAYPGKDKELDYLRYYIKLCSNQKNVGPEADLYSDTFDQEHNTTSLSKEELYRLYAQDQEKNGKGNCRFACSALALKLRDLGFETYETIILLKDTDDHGNKRVNQHFSNIFYSKIYGWMASDLFCGVACLYSEELDKIPASGMGYLQSYVDFLSKRAIGMAVRNISNDDKLKSEDIGFLDIRDFLDIYKKAGRPIDLSVPDEWVFLKDKSNRSKFLCQKAMQVKKDITSSKWA